MAGGPYNASSVEDDLSPHELRAELAQRLRSRATDESTVEAEKALFESVADLLTKLNDE